MSNLPVIGGRERLQEIRKDDAVDSIVKSENKIWLDSINEYLRNLDDADNMKVNKDAD